MATWPAGLPSPRQLGGIDPVDATVRTDMEVGAARSRRRTAARNDHARVFWVFDDADMATFRAWFDDADEAAGGAAWFNVDLAVGDGSESAVEARFIGPWKSDLVGPLTWQVTATLEIR